MLLLVVEEENLHRHLGGRQAAGAGWALLSSRERFCCAVRQCDCLEWLNYLRLRPQKAVAETSQAITSSGSSSPGLHLMAKRAPPRWNRSLSLLQGR